MRQRKSNFGVNSISVVVPAYNQQKTIIRDIKNIQKTLQGSGHKYEILIVDDGSSDATYKKALTVKTSKVKVFRYEKNQGKGHAIRYGMMRAAGDIVGFMDAGMDIHPGGFKMLLNHMEWYNADIIVGSKMHPVSKVEYPFIRRVLSWGYRFLTRTLFGFKIRDTQVGLKFFKRKVAKDVLPRLLVKKYAFDIEMLAVAYQRGYTRIYEAPVEINFKRNTITAFNLGKTIFNMLWDTMAVFYRSKILHYYLPKKKKNPNNNQFILKRKLLAARH